MNLLEELEKNNWDKSKILKIYYRNKEFDYMIDEYEFLENLGFDVSRFKSEILKLKYQDNDIIK